MDMIAGNLNGFTKEVMNGATVIANGIGAQDKVTLVIAAAVGLLVCFFGLKLTHVFSALCGVLIGALLGVTIAAALSLDGIMFGAVVLTGAVLVGALSFFLYKFGVFLMALSYASGTAAIVLAPDTAIMSVVCIVIGVIFAVLAVIFLEPILILITGIGGGVCAGLAVSVVTGIGKNMWGYVIGIAIAVIGVVVQFMMHSRKIGKKEIVYSSKVKEEVSRESEVEKARKLLEDEEDEEE